MTPKRLAEIEDAMLAAAHPRRDRKTHKRPALFQNITEQNQAIAEAVAAEREACAKIADILAQPLQERCGVAADWDASDTAKVIAVAIRARGAK
jgi:hypothetical protein